MRLLEACRVARVARIVYSSSSSVYGNTAVLPNTESAELLPRSPYAASKLAGEQYVLAFAPRVSLPEGLRRTWTWFERRPAAVSRRRGSASVPALR